MPCRGDLDPMLVAILFRCDKQINIGTAVPCRGDLDPMLVAVLFRYDKTDKHMDSSAL